MKLLLASSQFFHICTYNWEKRTVWMVPTTHNLLLQNTYIHGYGYERSLRSFIQQHKLIKSRCFNGLTITKLNDKRRNIPGAASTPIICRQLHPIHKRHKIFISTQTQCTFAAQRNNCILLKASCNYLWLCYTNILLDIIKVRKCSTPIDNFIVFA